VPRAICFRGICTSVPASPQHLAQAVVTSQCRGEDGFERMENDEAASARVGNDDFKPMGQLLLLYCNKPTKR